MKTATAIFIGLLSLHSMARSTSDRIHELVRDVYQYAYPIVLMDITKQQMTAVADATSEVGHAPINQFAHLKTYPDAKAKDVVRPNFDTLYSTAWIDLTKGPVVLTVPDTQGRYYLVPSLDMWTDVFASVGSRTTGTKAGHYAYIPKGWNGKLPADIVPIEAPTNTIWLIGRIQTNGPSDYQNVHQIQNGLKLTPLDQWKKNYIPPKLSQAPEKIVSKSTPMQEIAAMTGVQIFTRLAELMKQNPPHANDYPILFRMKQIGLVPGKSWEPQKLEKEILNSINQSAKEAYKDLRAGITELAGRKVNGWNITLDNMGTYGTSYRLRAVIALSGLGANLPADAIYPTAFLDSDGKQLQGGERYVLHFKKGQLPPANAFWSLTMYDEAGFQVPNPINRFAIGDRDKLNFNNDGSLTIYIQHGSPGKEYESNWLPSPQSGKIGPTLRVYSPEYRLLSGKWVPPPFQKVSGALKQAQEEN